VVHIYPDGFTGTKLEPNAQSLADAARRAQPGDVLYVHAGEHRAPIYFPRSGLPEKPIMIIGAGDGESIVRCPSESFNVIDASGVDELFIENLTLTGGRTAIKANGCKRMVVRRCTIRDISSGIVTFSPDAADWYIADNEITGRVKNWYPRVESSDTGINCPGSGHVICYNRVSRFWDGISIANYGKPSPEWANAAQPPQVAIDIYGNDVSEALDDGIEADYGLYNIRVFENRVMNVHSGISAQPNLGGPLYLFRNVVYNTTNTPLKLHNESTGLRVYHNTLIGAGQGFKSYPPSWQNAEFRNNLFLGARNYAIETGSPDPRTSLDYNGYARAPAAELLLKWSSDGGRSWTRHADLASFTRATGHEAHGVPLRYEDFVRAAEPQEGRTYPAASADLRLRIRSAAADAGCRLPGFNDHKRGSAPDLGAHEFGAADALYGPRAPSNIDKSRKSLR
jgi:hypothetical protein